MSDVILFLLSAVGFMAIVTTSTIMQPLRDWVGENFSSGFAEGINCSQCVGFWTGLFAAPCFVSVHSIFHLIFLACAGSAAAVIYSNVMDYVTANSLIDIGDDYVDDVMPLPDDTDNQGNTP